MAITSQNPTGRPSPKRGCLYAALGLLPALAFLVCMLVIGTILKTFGVFVAVFTIATGIFLVQKKHPNSSHPWAWGLSALMVFGLISGAISQRSSEARYTGEDLFAIEVAGYEMSSIRQVSSATYAKQRTLSPDSKDGRGRSFFARGGPYETSWRDRATKLEWKVDVLCRGERSRVLLSKSDPDRKARIEDGADGDVLVTIGPAEDLRFVARCSNPVGTR